MISPLRRKHRTTRRSSRESSIDGGPLLRACFDGRRNSKSEIRSTKFETICYRALVICSAYAAILVGVANVHADNTWSTTTQPPKLVWHPVRPSRPDAAVQDSSDKTKQAAKYDQNVSDDDPAPLASQQLKLAAGETDVIYASADSRELSPVKARQLAQRPSDQGDALPPPAGREIPPLQLDPQAVREPAELNPANPMRMGAPRNSVKTYQTLPPNPQPYTQ